MSFAEILESEFCPPLDTSLVISICHDFADDPNGLAKAREWLTPLKESALLEQETDFDPSGSGGQVYKANGEISSEIGDAATDYGAAQSESTERTGSSGGAALGRAYGSVSSGSATESSEELLELHSNEYLDGVEALDVPTKEAQLMEFFPSLQPSLITYTLRKCNNSFSKATDELLNHVYFEESTGAENKVATKGVDAFFVPEATARSKKGKGKKGRKPASPAFVADESEYDMSQEQTNKWKDGSQTIEFIASRVGMSTKDVASIYHRKGGSAHAALLEIIDTDVKKHEGEEPEPAVAEATIELISDFPSIDPVQAVALIRMTQPSTANAHELAKVLLSPSVHARGGLQVIPRYAPINLSDSSPTAPQKPVRSPVSSPGNVGALATARNTAFGQASAAYRKGKSDPLMRAVAGYYGQVGRDYDVALKSASAAEAEALVRSQSSATHLDLHGVSVKDATRIAQESVRMWWHELGEGRIGRQGVGAGYRIVTGVGNHSEGRRGKIGPAVGRMLVREGWKVEFGTGYLVVTGVAKRK